jgi:hypothetical protein
MPENTYVLEERSDRHHTMWHVSRLGNVDTVTALVGWGYVRAILGLRDILPQNTYTLLRGRRSVSQYGRGPNRCVYTAIEGEGDRWSASNRGSTSSCRPPCQLGKVVAGRNDRYPGGNARANKLGTAHHCRIENDKTTTTRLVRGQGHAFPSTEKIVLVPGLNK